MSNPIIHEPDSDGFAEFYINASVFGWGDAENTLSIKVTSEELILDLIADEEVIRTWGKTYQEIADELEDGSL